LGLIYTRKVFSLFFTQLPSEDIAMYNLKEKFFI